MKLAGTANNEFELLVVEYLHLLSRKLVNLDEEDAARDVLISPLNGEIAAQHTPALFSQGGQERLRINLAEAEQLDGGSLMLPFADEGEPESWFLFVRAAVAADSKAMTFKSVGYIKTDMRLVEFIQAAYHFILRRSVNIEELKTYEGLIKGRRLMRGDLLKMVASSDETQSRNVQFLIVPAPSRWLGSGASSTDPAARTARAVDTVPLQRSDPDDPPLGSVKTFPITLHFGG
jgi:hypothetical protein